MFTRRLTAFAVAVVAAAATTSIALAQYPPPGGNVTVTQRTPAPNVVLDVVPRDTAGRPIPNQECAATVPAGSGATLPNGGTFRTGADGVGTVAVDVSKSTGPVQVSIKCGTLDGSAVVLPAGAVKPPATGSAGTDEGSSPAPLYAAGLGLALVVAAGGSAIAVRRAAARR